jgi:hypothetical protein
MNFSDIQFDYDDKNLFQIDDLRLKADAIKFSILPKLHGIMNHAISQIREVYRVEALEDSHIELKERTNYNSTMNGLL